MEKLSLEFDKTSLITFGFEGFLNVGDLKEELVKKHMNFRIGNIKSPIVTNSRGFNVKALKPSPIFSKKSDLLPLFLGNPWK